MEFAWDLAVDNFDNLVSNAQRAEVSGFDSVLIINLNEALDPWIVATHIARQTTSINLLVAQNTNYYLPSVVAKTANSFQNLTGRKLDLNLVTGSSPIDIHRNVEPLDHAKRYKRTKEFAEVIRALKNDGKTSYSGEFFTFHNAAVFPPSRFSSRIFISGSSEDAMRTAAQYADCYLMFADYPQIIQRQIASCSLMAKDHFKRNLSYGILIDVIARQSAAEAWEVAEEWFRAVTEQQRKEKQMLNMFTDSTGVLNHRNLVRQQPIHFGEGTLWTGRSIMSKDHGLSIVGSYDQVIQTMKRFVDCGVNYFIMSGTGHDNEIERIGQFVLPYIH